METENVERALIVYENFTFRERYMAQMPIVEYPVDNVETNIEELSEQIKYFNLREE